MYQCRAKLYVMQSDGGWKERGVGALKLNVRSADGKSPRLGTFFFSLPSVSTFFFPLPSSSYDFPFPSSLVIPLPMPCFEPIPPERYHLLPYDPPIIINRGYSKHHIHSPCPTIPLPPSLELHSLVMQQRSIHPNTLIDMPQFPRIG